MTPKQRKEYKEANRRRAAVAQMFRSMPNPRSNNGVRRRFQELHDEWRQRNGLSRLTRDQNGRVVGQEAKGME